MNAFFSQFAAEIRRRKVLRVVAIYAIVAWIILQVAEVTFEPLGVPDWGMRAIVVAAIAGLPVSFLLAWIIDIRPEGLIFDLPLWAPGGGKKRTKRKSEGIYAIVLAVALAGGAYTGVGQFVEDLNAPPSKGMPPPAVPVAARQAPAQAKNSIAVLAFANFDGNTESGYFASGLAEEILNLLAAIKEIQVAARTSSFRFRDEKHDIREVANLLGVANVLEGSVRRSGNLMRVTAQLINGENGFNTWSQNYDRELNDIFSIQEEIAAAVVNELKIALSLDSKQKLQYRPTDNVDAYIYYLEGRGRLRNSIDSDVTRTAGQLFEKALAIDPNFSRAHAGMCEVNLRLFALAKDTEAFQLAETSCNLARELDSGVNSEVDMALAILYRHRGLYEQSEIQIRKSIAIDPKNPDAYIELAELHDLLGQPQEAEANYLRAIDLRRNYWAAHSAIGGYYYRNHRYEEAAQSYELASSLAPDVTSTFIGKGAAYNMLGDKERMRQAYDQSLKLKPSRYAYTNRGLHYYYNGQYQDAVDMQEQALFYAPDDHRIWGRLAESYRFLSNGREKSQAAYDKAEKLANDVISVSPKDWESIGLRGLYLAHLGQLQEAQELSIKAVEMSGNSAKALYFMALVHVETDDTIGALIALEASVAADEGYRRIIAEDPDLQVLQDNPRFQALTK